MAKKITPQQLAARWATLPNKFEVNVLDFEVIMGAQVEAIFKKSFYLNRFNAPGSPSWPARTDRKSHPLLQETGNLKRSITHHRIVSGKNHGVLIYSAPSILASSKRQYGRNFYYSRIHNLGGVGAKASGSARLIKQRQFIGHSAYIIDKLKSNSSRIFNGFPQ